MSVQQKVLVDSGLFEVILQRLAHQLLEDFDDFSNIAVIGLQPRGIELMNRVVAIVESDLQRKLLKGKLDITFYRDDYRRGEDLLKTYETDINFSIEGKTVLLIDDVLYTGRSINAALTALNHYGRPKRVCLLSLVDRRYDRQLPIESNYNGITVDALDGSRIKVEWKDIDGKDSIILKSDEK